MVNELDGKVLTLKSVYSKDRKIMVQPVFDVKTRWYLGVPRLSEEDKKKLDFWVDENSKLFIRHNDTFDLNDKIDRQNWEWVQHSNAIAKSFEECQKSSEALFYVDNEEIENQKSLSSDDLLLESLQKIKSDRDDMLEGRVRILGFNMEDESPASLRAFLNRLAKDPKTVRKVLESYTANSVSVQLIFMRALDMEVIKEERQVYTYGNTILGVTTDSCISFLQETENKELLIQIEKEIALKRSASKAEKPSSDEEKGTKAKGKAAANKNK